MENKIKIGKVKKYTDDFFKLTEIKNYREKIEASGNSNKIVVRGIHEEKLIESLSRTRSTIFELMMCNPWEYFVTLTLNKEFVERDNIETFRSKFTRFIKNYNARYNLSISYCIIPEICADNTNYHGHGAISGIPLGHLTKIEITDKAWLSLLTLVAMGREIYRWNEYDKTFGASAIEPIISKESIAKYCTKYVTKSLNQTPVGFNKRLFYASQGLKRAEVIHEGEIMQSYEPDFENDYVKIKNFKAMDEALMLFIENNEGSADNE